MSRDNIPETHKNKATTQQIKLTKVLAYEIATPQRVENQGSEPDISLELGAQGIHKCKCILQQNQYKISHSQRTQMPIDMNKD
uniref:Uncharacterized protein n=1 Tax=Rhizophora mucronata TaxID=61149 RepID=A0A2P2NZU8_RHIMU